ncbi:hypothetical protein QAD02_000770 [Eretmocerus hayati]|uniref:Uncharacterized protein n=1 Tax=Eretmocerus hayati TaxID=131215 RepID=A0ACC2NF48_9HYME|nr:hypothetical protein QAD02_000770 [Eretmocerus hayati]
MDVSLSDANICYVEKVSLPRDATRANEGGGARDPLHNSDVDGSIDDSDSDSHEGDKDAEDAEDAEEREALQRDVSYLETIDDLQLVDYSAKEFSIRARTKSISSSR